MIKKLGEFLALLVIATVFVSLGIWQLNRAADLKTLLATASVIDTRIVRLESLGQPRVAFLPKSDHRTVSASGNYVANFRAPNQVDGAGSMQDWEVGLLQVEPQSAILVVRGLWSQRLVEPRIAMSDRIAITGTFLAHQNEDHSENAPGIISRLDSSVIVGLTDLDLYDGYVISTSEKFQGRDIVRTRVTPPALTSRIPGYYWQHLSYVVIWWLMAGVVLYLPLYRRRVKILETVKGEVHT